MFATTDASGTYVFQGLLPGTYYLIAHAATQANRQVQVQEHGDVRVDLSLTSQFRRPRYDPNNIPKPYGAPPARRRIV